MNDFANTLLQLFLYILRIITPFFALLIIYQCFSSLRNHRRQEQPLITLGNLATRDLIPVIYWENSIGRGKTCDIRLGDNTVSRDHAVLYRREDAWLIADTNSKSGVMVNGTKIDKPTPVYIGDTVAVGSTVLVMQKADRARKARASWFFDGREQKTSASPVTLLFLTSLLHFILALQLCFAGEGFSPAPFLPYALMTGAAWVFFLVSRLAFHRASFELETLAFLLSGVGIILIGGYDLGSTYMQIATMAMGMVLFSFMIWFLQEPDRVTKWRLWIAAAAVAVLGINLIIGTAVNGSKNWIIIGPISIQPSEFVKIALILVGTSTLARLQTTKNLTEFIGFSAICVGALFLMSDFGTACIFFLTFLIIAFIRSGDVRTIIFIVAAACLGAFLILQFKPYIADRFAVWGHAWEYLNDTGYQQARVMSYAASGGLFGVGVGQGNLQYVFASTSDLIFGMLCEETGLLFAIIIAAVIAGLAFYARAISATSRSTLYSIAACSVGGMFVFQSCLNIFGATDLLPLTGVTLPFVSMGGSSMMACWGLLSFIKAADERTYQGV